MQARSIVAVFISLMIVAGVLIGIAAPKLLESKAASPASNYSLVVEIRNFKFIPENASISINATVTWMNNDSVPHTVTSLSGAPSAFDSGTVNPGGSYSYKFAVPGTYQYQCQIHPFMLGNVTVVAGNQSASVDISSFAFHPENTTVAVGTTVTWTNNDSMTHTVTTKPGAPISFDSGNVLPGATFSFTFTQPGIYPYYCKIHPFMLGNVTVTS